MRKIIGLWAITVALGIPPAMAASDAAIPARDYPAPKCAKPDDSLLKSSRPKYSNTGSSNTGGQLDSGNVGSYNSLAKAYNQAAQTYNACISSYDDTATGEITRLHDEAAAHIKQVTDNANARIKWIEQQIRDLVDEVNVTGTAHKGDAGAAQYPPADCKKPGALKPGRRTIAQTAQYDREEQAYQPCVAGYIAAALDEIEKTKNRAIADTKQIAAAANDRIELIKARIRDAGAGPERVASAEPPAGALESVTVTASKASAAAINSFILSHATPTRMTGKLARWKTGICPLTAGLEPKFAAMVTQRVRDVAASVGAPVDRDPVCNANIQITFTATPQALLDTIRTEHPSRLGYADNRQQAARLAMVTHAIQSWYVTATADLRGHVEVDDPRPAGVTLDMPAAPGTGPGGINSLSQGTIRMDLPGASIKYVTGNRLGDGLSSEFSFITIVAEPARLTDFEIGAQADYIAMLALSQPGAMDGCEALPSITNLLSPGCNTIARTITDGDLAYLRGLYAMTPAGSLQQQRGQVRYQMEQVLKRD